MGKSENNLAFSETIAACYLMIGFSMGKSENNLAFQKLLQPVT